MSVAISVKDLRVDYGEFTAVKDISFEVEKGELLGFIGANGAGKTSTFEALATLLRPTYGDLVIDGVDALESPEEVRKRLGYMPDLAPVPSDLRVWEFLDFYAQAHGIQKGIWKDCLELVDLTEKSHSWCRALSRGQTQRLVLAKTLLHTPKVLILDEPASGLDTYSRRKMRNILNRLVSDGATVMISSHIMGELDELCSSLCILNLGEIIAQGTTSEVIQKLASEKEFKIETLSNVSDLSAWLDKQEKVTVIKSEQQTVSFRFTGTDSEQAELLYKTLEAGHQVKSLFENTSNLEDIIVRLAESNLKL